MRIERIGGSRLHTDSEVWGLDQTTWELMESISGDTTGNEDMCDVKRRAKSSGVDSGSARTVTETATYATVL